MIGNANKCNPETRVRRRMTSSDTSDEHSSDELLMNNTATTRLGRPNGDGKASSSSSESCHYSSNQVGRLPTNGQGPVLDSDQHAVGQWLQFLQMEMYLQGFFDNGYDDFETIKQIGAPDLEAIGVSDQHHRAFLLDAVRVLREQGAVWVYLLHEEADMTSDQFPDRASAGGSSGIASGNSSSIPWTLSSSEPDPEYAATTTSSSGAENSPRTRGGSSSKLHRCKAELTPGHYPWPPTSTPASNNSASRFQQPQSHPLYSNHDDDADLIQKVTDLNFSQYVSEPEKQQQQQKRNKSKSETKPNKAKQREKRQNQVNQEDERPQLTSMQLAILVKEKLHKECINLASAPFNTKAGDDYLSGLAARYASELGTDEVDVLHQLDDFRQLLLENSSQIINNDSSSSSTKKHHLPNSGANNVTTTMMMMGESSRQNECHISPISGQRINNVDCRISPISGHTYANLHDPYTSNNQRTFSPGIYASSSCLSDKEEDIYDLAAKYERGDRGRFFGSPAAVQKLKLSPPGWYTKARKAISKNNFKNDDFTTTSSDFSSSVTTDFHIASPTFMRTFLPNTPTMQQDNGGQQRFSTRTRLRPGGPSHDRQSHSTTRVNNKSTISSNRRPGSALSNFEEVGMRTMGSGGSRFLQDPYDPFPPSGFAHTMFKGQVGGNLGKPTTPIVKQRTFNGSGVASSPRVQMYRTRVVYNDARPSSAGLMAAHEAAV